MQNCRLFLAFVWNSYDWWVFFTPKNQPLKMEFKYILFCKQPLCSFMHSLCVKMKIFLCDCTITKEIASCLTRIITQKEGFTVQRMLINQNAVFLPGHACCIIYANNMIM